MSRMSLRKIADSEYAGTRRVAMREFRDLSDADIEAILVERFPDAAPEDVENFMKTLQKIGKVAAPIAQKALPGVISGASTGMVAGPWGALAGGLAGGAASLLSGGGGKGRSAAAPQRAASVPQRPAPQSPTPAISTPAPAAQRPAPTPVVSAPPPAPWPATLAARSVPRPVTPATSSADPVVDAAARLIVLLSRPQIQQALLALLLGDAGRQSLTVGKREVPVEALAEALAETAADLADAALADHRRQVSDDWLADAGGQPVCDTTDPTQRTRVLFSGLVSESRGAPSPQARRRAGRGR